MEITEAIQILGLDENFTQKDLISAYKKNIAENDPASADIDELGTFSESANKLYDISKAYLLLRDKELAIGQESVIQPLVIFTDASVQENMDVAAFGIVAINIQKDFEVPCAIINKYNIRSHGNSDTRTCKFSGLIANFDTNSAEIMGILAALEIFSYLARETAQKIVFYTDSLVAKKVLSDKRMPPRSKLYLNFRKTFLRIINLYSLEVVIKKVKAHQGIESNELADQLAKRRLTN